MNKSVNELKEQYLSEQGDILYRYCFETLRELDKAFCKLEYEIEESIEHIKTRGK